MAKHLVAVYDSFEYIRGVVDELLGSGVEAGAISLIVARPSPATGFGANPLAVDDQDADPAAAGAEALMEQPTGIALPLKPMTLRDFGASVAHGPVAERLADVDGDDDFLAVMLDLGIKEERIDRFADAVRRGGLLLAVDTTAEAVQGVKQIMARHHPVNLKRQDGDFGSEPLTVFDRGQAPAAPDSVGDERQPVDKLINAIGLDEREEYEDSKAQNYQDGAQGLPG
ncbi:MAG TPA: hypothetical protein VEH84_11850 [Alphaproteobacteria bacterium]|nr:hypothetical protein [Alphaproteobacteria bacterium]